MCIMSCGVHKRGNGSANRVHPVYTDTLKPIYICTCANQSLLVSTRNWKVETDITYPAASNNVIYMPAYYL